MSSRVLTFECEVFSPAQPWSSSAMFTSGNLRNRTRVIHGVVPQHSGSARNELVDSYNSLSFFKTSTCQLLMMCLWDNSLVKHYFKLTNENLSWTRVTERCLLDIIVSNPLEASRRSASQPKAESSHSHWTCKSRRTNSNAWPRVGEQILVEKCIKVQVQEVRCRERRIRECCYFYFCSICGREPYSNN